MANNQTQFSIAIEKPTTEEHGWLVKKLTDDGDEDEPLYSGINYDDYNCFGDGGVFAIYSEDSGNPDAAADLLQAFLKEFRPKQTIGFEVAYTCDKPRPGEFGGGACFITSRGQRWTNTGMWLQEQKTAYEKHQKWKKKSKK